MNKENLKNEENELLQKWFEDTVVEDREECVQIAETAMNECLKRWNVFLGDAQTTLAFYSIIYDCILEKLKEKQGEGKEQFAINIGDIVEIGYDNSEDDEESEKAGNFSPYIFDGEKKIQVDENPDLSTVERCTEWSSKNIEKQRKTLDQIATNALKALAEKVDVHLSSNVVVFPCFCTIHEQLVEYMRLKHAELNENEVSINFAGNFDIYARVVEGGDVAIEYSPKPSQKLSIKSDATATAVHDDED